MRCRAGTLFAIFLTMTLAGPAAAVSTGHWNALTAPGFVQCASRVDCEGAGQCQDSALEILNGDCDVSCIKGDAAGSYGCSASVRSDPEGYMIGGVGFTEGHSGHYLAASLGGVRLTPGLFRLNGSVSSSDQIPGPHSAQVAVFRFAGDPTVFEGVQADEVGDLVALGLIEEGDVLFTTLLTIDNGPLAEEIDVTGIPDDEIVIFGAQSAVLPVPVPAVGATGVLLLATVLLGLGARYALRQRSR